MFRLFNMVRLSVRAFAISETYPLSVSNLPGEDYARVKQHRDDNVPCQQDN